MSLLQCVERVLWPLPRSCSCFVSHDHSHVLRPQAVETAREAEKCDPHNPHAHYLLFKAALLAHDKDLGEALVM